MDDTQAPGRIDKDGEAVAHPSAIPVRHTEKRQRKPYITAKTRAAFQHHIAVGGSMASTLRSVGYSESIAKYPSKVTNSAGWRELARITGFDEAFVTAALKEDIENKPAKRVQELALAADILGMRSKDPGEAGNSDAALVRETLATLLQRLRQQ